MNGSIEPLTGLRLLSRRRLDDGEGFVFATGDGYPVLAADKVFFDPLEKRRKRKIGVSVSSGCGVGCRYCFTHQYRTGRALTAAEILAQAEWLITRNDPPEEPFDEFKLSFKQMGEPALNRPALLEAVARWRERAPETLFVVSSSGPREVDRLVNELVNLLERGARIRLQFSCHTTDDEERRRLSPRRPMLTLAELAGLARRWPGGPVTLNFMLLDGYTCDPDTLARLFPPERVFIKLNHLDPNRFTRSLGLADRPSGDRQRLAAALSAYGFEVAHRIRAFTPGPGAAES